MFFIVYSVSDFNSVLLYFQVELVVKRIVNVFALFCERSVTDIVMLSLNRLHAITSLMKNMMNPSTNKTPEWQFYGRDHWHTFKNTV